MGPKDADGMANSVDPDQTLVWVYTICPDLSVLKLRFITVLNKIYQDLMTLNKIEDWPTINSISMRPSIPSFSCNKCINSVKSHTFL